MCFDAFPFPDATKAQKANIRDLAEQLDSHRKRQQAQHPDLTLTSMYNVLEKLRTGEVLNDKEKITHQQGLITILKELHDDLDRAVFDAYGWNDLAQILVGKAGATTPLPSKPDDQTQAEELLLSRLVALNAQRFEEEAQGQIRWLRPEFQAPESQPINLQVELIETESTPVITPTSKQTWPKVLQDQIKLVRDLLSTRPQTVENLAAHFKRNPQKQLQAVLDALSALGHIVQDNNRYRIP